MIRIGIDYSITSPSMCVEHDGGYRFISFYDNEGKDIRTTKSKKFYHHQQLTNIIELVSYNRVIDKTNYRTEQQSKMKSAWDLTHIIVQKIIDVICELNISFDVNNKLVIGIEGFSFGSVSSSYIDLIMFQSYLRCELMNVFEFMELVIVPPTEVKKTLSGKGNSNKETMIRSFIDNRLNDDKLISNPFYKYCRECEFDYKNVKPIDDLVDSYSILKSI